MADVFLSYAGEDRATAAALGNALEAAGWSVWWDRELVAGGARSSSRTGIALSASNARWPSAVTHPLPAAARPEDDRAPGPVELPLDHGCEIVAASIGLDPGP